MMIHTRSMVRPQPARRRLRGFTLIEAALMTVIIGVGVVAMLQLLATGTVSNLEGNDSTTGLNLARNIRELCLSLSFADPTTPTHWGHESGETLFSYDDLDDLDGKTFSPPIDARRQTISSMDTWAQAVQVQSVDPNRLTAVVPKGSSPAARITVTVTHRGQFVTSMSWLAFDAAN